MRFTEYFFGFLLLFSAASTVQAQPFTLPGIPGLSGGSSEQADEQQASPEQLTESLEVTIQALQDDESRQALVEQLKALQQGLVAESSQTAQTRAGGEGLLGALAVLFDEAANPDSNAESPLGKWKANFRNAYSAAEKLLAGASFRVLMETLAGLTAWLFALWGLSRLARMLYAWRDWPVEMPRQPRPWMLIAHLARRLLPWLITFTALLAGLPTFGMSEGAQTTVLILAYAALCARALTTFFDVTISIFSSGHRQTAVLILRRRILVPLFIIGALFALEDALGTAELTSQLGTELASALALIFSIVAALLSFFLIIRNRRPVTHLIRNRPYKQRKNQGVGREVTALLARLWHIPMLLAISASVVAVFANGGEADEALGRAMICALLLAATLAIQGLFGIQENSPKHRALSKFSQRLVRFGYRLLQIAAWMAFFELILQTWDLSLLGLGEKPPISVGLTNSLIGIILTWLIASIAWIFVDELLERALREGDRKKRINPARAQTIVPIARNTLLITIIVVGIFVGLSTLGVDVTPLLAGAGIIGLAVGFGAQTLVQDLITGLFIVVEDSMSVGDFVEINGFMGTVEGFNLRTVRLRDLEGVVHHITFSKISSIHNMSRQFGIALIKIRIPRELPIDDAILLMEETAEELRTQPDMRWLIWSPLEMQGIHSFEEGCPVLRMRMRTKPECQWDVSRAFNLLLKRNMEERYIDVAAPRISVEMNGEGGAGAPLIERKAR
ncbi:mechanosensitive ion channel domain-containing protein [Marinobacter sp. 2_MG-2023]|uniref:mechanosensitive ion channel domain-containing protein n=1 Tax=Marinobacter sp. 2_MG-2023 TaxID=3062679 RepID=UPI0026E212B1|nr:mechanosensitive ion channel domain-containing protein [Marinobacter sp. 2_MG-2023]MDO6443721.1 mechanosensitive ion channel [Marinobacter sp. 2_MG-2023]